MQNYNIYVYTIKWITLYIWINHVLPLVLTRHMPYVTATHSWKGNCASGANTDRLFCGARGLAEWQFVDVTRLVYFLFARGLCSAKLSVQVGWIMPVVNGVYCYVAPHWHLLYCFNCVVVIFDATLRCICSRMSTAYTSSNVRTVTKLQRIWPQLLHQILKRRSEAPLLPVSTASVCVRVRVCVSTFCGWYLLVCCFLAVFCAVQATALIVRAQAPNLPASRSTICAKKPKEQVTFGPC